MRKSIFKRIETDARLLRNESNLLAFSEWSTVGYCGICFFPELYVL